MPTRSDWPRTKTWLPTTDSRAPSRSRWRGYVPAALLFGLLVIAGLYLSVLRPGPDNPAPDSAGTPTDAAADPGTGGTGDSGTGGGGSAGSRTVGGVPVGYPHTREGAQAAAANYLSVYGSAAMFDPSKRADIIDAMVARIDHEQLTAQLDESFGLAGDAYGLDSNGLPADGLEMVARTVPIGVTVESYSSVKAVVDVWAVSIVGLSGTGSTRPVSEAWNTATVTLRWADGDWKWATLSQRDGPTPVSGLQPPSPADQLADAVQRFEELRHGR